MDKFKKFINELDKKIILGVLGVFGLILVFIIINKLTVNPIIECQKYVENWKETETNTLGTKVMEAKNQNQNKLNEVFSKEECANMTMNIDVNKYNCRTYEQQINIEYNERMLEINKNYSNKIKACSVKN